MPLRMFREQPVGSRRDASCASPPLGTSEVHRALAELLRALLGEGNTLGQRRRDADDAMVDANALVQARDAQLDAQVQQLATQLRFEEACRATTPPLGPRPPRQRFFHEGTGRERRRHQQLL